MDGSTTKCQVDIFSAPRNVTLGGKKSMVVIELEGSLESGQPNWGSKRVQSVGLTLVMLPSYSTGLFLLTGVC